jgi:hypothetical protein
MAGAGVAAIVSTLLALLVGSSTAWASPAPPAEPGGGDLPGVLPAMHTVASSPAAWQLAAFGLACAAVGVLITLAVAHLVSGRRTAPTGSPGALAA